MNSITLTDEFRALVPAHHSRATPRPGHPAATALRLQRPGARPLRLEAEHLLSAQRPATLEPDMTLHIRLFSSPGGELVLVLERSRAGGRPQLVRAVRGMRAALIADDFTRIDASALLAFPAEMLLGEPAEAVLAAHAAFSRRITQIRRDFALLCAEVLNPAPVPPPPPPASPTAELTPERSDPCLD